MERRMSNNTRILAERARIVWLWLGGASARSISQQTGASLSVVYRWIHRWQEEGSVRTRPYHRELRRLRWNDSYRLSTPGTINVPSTPTRTVRPQATLLTSEQPSSISMSQATLATTNSSFGRQFHYPVITDFSFQDYPYCKRIQKCFSQALWHSTLPLL
ncbi:hypothetical protein Pcinc_007852 [Petrolisthes cinctipes]|uniref:Uncharacterized protein n=1 Tax=Petrolisthes cinctipes TaxID=88211 RepID=A0AAE1GAC6_PETCI|nr:hypothetical protein Pcinc_007852 [Petrolisthes cinctipes]